MLMWLAYFTLITLFLVQYVVILCCQQNANIVSYACLTDVTGLCAKPEAAILLDMCRKK